MRYYLITGLVIILAITFILWFYLKDKEVEGILEANGQVRGTEITVSSELSGRIETIAVEEGQRIKEGDLIAKISSQEIEARLEQAKAEVEGFKNRLKEIEAGIKGINTSIEQAKINVKFVKEDSFHRIHQAEANLQKAEATVKEVESQWNLANMDYERYSKLVKEGIVSQREFEEMETRFKTSQARLDAAKKAAEEARAMMEKAEVSALEIKVKEREYQRLLDDREGVKATYDMAKNQLNAALARVREIEAIFKDVEIYAPSNGSVINKLVEEGETVIQGTPIATLIDLSDIYVKVYIPEKDIGKIRLGNPVRIYTDAFPDRFFNGKVTEISQRAEFTPKEVHMKEERTKLVFGVKVGIENPEGYLKPGMPVDAKIKWMEGVNW